MAETVIFRLSSIDNSATREYIRICLCYPCGTEHTNIAEAAGDLTAATQRTINRMPILAGNLCSVDSNASNSKENAPSQRRESTGTSSETDFLSGGQFRRATIATNPFALLQTSSPQQLEDGHTDERRGLAEIQVKLEDVAIFKPIFKYLNRYDFPYSYRELVSNGIPATAFHGDFLAPLADGAAAEEACPVFAVQANFINGGVLVTVCLHKTVGDDEGLAAVIRCMSSPNDELPACNITAQGLQRDAIEQSRIRDRVCGSRGVRADAIQHPEYALSTQNAHTLAKQATSKILRFDLKMIEGTRDMVNERFHYIRDQPSVNVTTFDVLLAILWKAIIRARYPRGNLPSSTTTAALSPSLTWRTANLNINKATTAPVSNDPINPPSTLYLPISLSRAGRFFPSPIVSNTTESTTFPPNTTLLSPSTAATLRLCTNFDISTLTPIAHDIHTSRALLGEQALRSKIALINETPNIRTLHTLSGIEGTQKDVVIEDWSGLLSQENTGLGMRLGNAEAYRKITKDGEMRNASAAATLLKNDEQKGFWEVCVVMSEEEMERMVGDEGLEPFLVG